MGGSLNVFINTKLMKDRDYAEAINLRAEEMLADGCKRADIVYKKVFDRIR
jgi:formiminotetrahydrofolate cyclodeaminase